MLAVVVSGITASEVFGKDSLFLTMLRASGLDYGNNPVFQALRRVGVASVMDRSFVQVGQLLSRAQAHEILNENPAYLLIRGDEAARVLMPAVELAKFLESPGNEDAAEFIDLLRIPAARLEVASIHLQASLQEAWTLFEESTAEALIVERMTAPGILRVDGVLMPETVEKSYRF
jgi:chloride channel protein, CIC family